MRAIRLGGSFGLAAPVLMFIVAHAGCSSSSTNNAPDGGGATQPDGSVTNVDEGGSDAGEGGAIDLPKPVLCPETDPFHPKLPNSVVVSDVVMPADAHWTADKVYLIGGDFKVEGHTLTVDPGTTICLYQTGKIFVGEGIDPGEIHLNGTADKPIVITTTPSASDPTKPDVFHGGIKLDTYEGSTVSYVNIWYGGPGGGGASYAFELTDTARGTPDATKPLKVDHVVVGAVQSKGVRVGTPLGVADGSAIQFTGFVTPDPSGPALDVTADLNILAEASFAKAFTSAGASIPDAAKLVRLNPEAADGSLDKNTDLVDFGIPFIYPTPGVLAIRGAQDDTAGATLTIHEGVNLKMKGAIVIGGTSGTAYGNLIVSGTTAKPVVFTSTEATPAKGDWEGFYFVNPFFDPNKSKIDNAQILYAGVSTADPLQVNYHVGRCGSFNAGAVMIAGTDTAAYAGPPITNTHIGHSASDGIVSSASNTNGALSTNYAKPDITFEDIAQQNLRIGVCP